MKQSILNFCFLSTIMLLVGFASCKKEDKDCDKDQCKNAVEVLALNSDQFVLGHFTQEKQDIPLYLFAENYADYRHQIQAGHHYKLAYVTVECKNYLNWCGNGFAEGGCILDRKCIRITCLKEIPQNNKTCFNSLIDSDRYTKEVSVFNQKARIEGNTLKADVTFSGCSENDPVAYTLICRPAFIRCPGIDSKILLAKIVQTDPGLTCMAVFTKTVCFDLNTIRKAYLENGSPVQENIPIHLDIGNGSVTLDYKLQ